MNHFYFGTLNLGIFSTVCLASLQYAFTAFRIFYYSIFSMAAYQKDTAR